MNDGTFFMPGAASTIAQDVDAVYYFVYWVCVFFFLLIIGLMVLFVIRYRRRSEHDTTPHISHHTLLEVAWSTLPVFLLAAMFVWGFDIYMRTRVAPADAMEVNVTAQKWSWSFEYPNGLISPVLGIPVNTPVRLLMNSQDVLHSFYVPNFRQKMDVIPNRYTTTWFEANTTGVFPIFCTEYCGDGHSAMLSRVHVMEQADYEEWLNKGGMFVDIDQIPLEDYGEILYTSQLCNTCHSSDGTRLNGPTFQNLFGRTEQLTDGSSVVVDENYIRESLMQPNAKVVATYQPIMPTFQGRLDDRQISALIAYIKSLSGEANESEN